MPTPRRTSLDEDPAHGNLTEVTTSPGVCQRWNTRQHSWVRTSDGGFNPDWYTVTPIDERTAKTFITRHHYTGTYPAASRRYGLHDQRSTPPTLVGVAVFSIPAQARVLTNVFPDLEPYTASLELGRFCLLGTPAVTRSHPAAQAVHDPVAWAHPDDPSHVPAPPGNTESWFLARCFDLLHRSGIRGIVSFADPVPRNIAGRLLFPGHVGVIYQASNAIYTGRGTARTLTVLPDGTSLSDRALQKVRTQDQGHDYVERRLIAMGAQPRQVGANPNSWLIDALNDVRATRLRHRGNLRYAMVTNRHDRRHLTITGGPLPYPKRPDLA